MNFIERFVFNFIKTHMNHSNRKQRNIILNALTTGMEKAFYEDNLVTRYYGLIQWLLDNDNVFQQMIMLDGNDVRKNLADVIRDAVLEYKKE